MSLRRFATSVFSLFTAFCSENDPQQWHILIDSSLLIQKAALHKGIVHPSIARPIGCAIHMKESTKHETVVQIYTGCNNCNWNIGGDLKILELLL